MQIYTGELKSSLSSLSKSLGLYFHGIGTHIMSILSYQLDITEGGVKKRCTIPLHSISSKLQEHR